MTSLSRRHSLASFDDHPSLSASLESFSPCTSSPESPTMLRPQYSGFKSKSEASDPATQSSMHQSSGPEPNFWPYRSGTQWYQPNPNVRGNSHPGSNRGSNNNGPGSRAGSEDAVRAAARIPLPLSQSPEPPRERSSAPATAGPVPFPPSGMITPPPTQEKKEVIKSWVHGQSREAGPPVLASPAKNQAALGPTSAPDTPKDPDNYFRFSLRTEVQQRTDGIEALVNTVSSLFGTRRAFITTCLVVFMTIWSFKILTSTPTQLPTPDVIKVAGLARSFEPMIYYSENGVGHAKEISETSNAVWDLSESVRYANFTSAPIIVEQLEELCTSLRSLSHELTNFFTNVDADIDNILIMMDWAKRELGALPTPSSFPLATAASNVQDFLARMGVLVNKNTGEATALGTAVAAVIGNTPAEAQRRALRHTFKELLSMFEETINNELTLTTTLFTLFGSIDLQFRNLQRTTVREFDIQDKLETDLLSTMWVRAVGGHRGKLKKYEKNKSLLQSVRSRTVANRNLVEEHNGKLMALKQSLESLRRRLVGPLLKDGDDSHSDIAEQVRGIENIWGDLRTTRESQKGKFMEALYGNSATKRARELEAQKQGRLPM